MFNALQRVEVVEDGKYDALKWFKAINASVSISQMELQAVQPAGGHLQAK